MKQIFFEDVTIQNFLSVGHDPVKVEFNCGFNIITGSNKDKEDRRNGVGKSTIADAINFVIFGSTLRDLKKELIPNNLTNSTCSVLLNFKVVTPQEINLYSINRTLSPSKCYIYKNEQDITRDSIINTNEFIQEVINCGEDVFQNCVIMTVNNTVPFMAKKKVEKRKFIEGIFNLQIFGDMISHLRNDYNETRKDFDIESTRYSENVTSLDNFKDQKIQTVKDRRNKKEKYKNRQKNNEQELLEIKNKLLNIRDTIIEENEKLICKFEDKLKDLDKIKTVKRDKLSELKASHNQLKSNLIKIGTNEEICPTCLRQIDNNDKDHIEKEIKITNKDINDIESEIKTITKDYNLVASNENKLNKGINKIRKKIKQSNDELTNQKLLKQKAKQLLDWQGQLKVDIKELNSEDTNLDNIINDYNNKVKEIKSKLETVKKKINMLDVVKYIVSEEGVKSYIVKQILQVFNQKLAYYLKKMDSNCVCIFNEYFEEQIINEKNKLCSYFNFSGAERKNIDLACLFAFMDIRRLQGDVTFNFSIYDELFDSSLDEKGVDLVTSILRERVEKYKECVYVISHRKESVKAATGEVVYLEKSNGITRRVKYAEIDKD